MEELEKRWATQDRPEDFHDFWDTVMIEWVDHMFEYAGITLPDTDRIELFQ